MCLGKKNTLLKCCERAMKRPDREGAKGRTINNWWSSRGAIENWISINEQWWMYFFLISVNEYLMLRVLLCLICLPSASRTATVCTSVYRQSEFPTWKPSSLCWLLLCSPLIMAPLQTKGAGIYIRIAAARLKNLPRDKTRSLKSALVSTGAAQLSKVEIWRYIIVPRWFLPSRSWCTPELNLNQ